MIGLMSQGNSTFANSSSPHIGCIWTTSNSSRVNGPGLLRNFMWHLHLPDVVQVGAKAVVVCSCSSIPSARATATALSATRSQ